MHEVDDSIVEERDPDLERRRHAHLVGEQEQALRKRRLRVHVQERVGRIQTGLPLVRRAEVRLRSGGGHRPAQQRLDLLGRQNRDQPEVLLRERQVRVPRPRLGVASEVAQHGAAVGERLARPFLLRRRVRQSRREVAPIATEELVAPDAGHRHLHLAMRQLRDQERHQERRIGQRLVEVLDQGREEVDDPRLNDQSLVLGAEVLRDTLGVGRLVVIAVRAVEADTERAHAGARRLAHEGHHRRRVDAAAEERAQRDVADHLIPHGLPEERDQLRAARLEAGPGPLLVEAEIPVRLRSDLAALGDETPTGGKLANAPEQGARRLHEPQPEELRGRLQIGAAVHARERQQRFDLRSEREPLPSLDVVQRLHAGAVTRHQQSSALEVPQREREDAVEAGDALVVIVLVGVDDDFRVRPGAEAVALALQLIAELSVVVDLAVEHHGDRPVLVVDRLVAAGQIDDAQPRHAEADAVRDHRASVVGTPMRDRRAHLLERTLQLRASEVPSMQSRDPAHRLAPCRPGQPSHQLLICFLRTGPHSRVIAIGRCFQTRAAAAYLASLD